mmetsp:Transcript_99422/g.257147  ORF Transcript_99422/g.257147 Transcript_99422/m.257147 type:complete len:273 (-) Transcript_99422:477-1295(-)
MCVAKDVVCVTLSSTHLGGSSMSIVHSMSSVPGSMESGSLVSSSLVIFGLESASPETSMTTSGVSMSHIIRSLPSSSLRVTCLLLARWPRKRLNLSCMQCPECLMSTLAPPAAQRLRWKHAKSTQAITMEQEPNMDVLCMLQLKGDARPPGHVQSYVHLSYDSQALDKTGLGTAESHLAGWGDEQLRLRFCSPSPQSASHGPHGPNTQRGTSTEKSLRITGAAPCMTDTLANCSPKAKPLSSALVRTANPSARFSGVTLALRMLARKADHWL